MVNEAADGADTVVWLRQAALVHRPVRHHRAVVPGIHPVGAAERSAAGTGHGRDHRRPARFRASVWGTGSFAVNDFLGWSDLVAHQEDPARIRAGIRQLRAPRRVARAAVEVPMGESARALLGAGAPWFESWAEHPTPTTRSGSDAVRRRAGPRAGAGAAGGRLARHLPAARRCSSTGICADRGVDVALTVGPWTHTRAAHQGAGHQRAGITGLAGHPSGRRAATAAPERGPRLRHRPGLAQSAGLAARHHRTRAVPAARRPPGRSRRRTRRAAAGDVPLRPG